MCVSTGTKPAGQTTMTTMMKALRFGIEIETVGLHCGQLARAIHTVVGGTIESSPGGSVWYVQDVSGRRWKAEPDGSLSGGTNSGEIVSPILGYDDLVTVQNIVNAVLAAGARADASTGIHIHVDGGGFSASHIINLVKFMHKQERLLEHVFAAHAQRLYYCQPIDEAFLRRIEASRPQTLEAVSRAWYGYTNPRPQRRDSSRYRGLNLNSFFRSSRIRVMPRGATARTHDRAPASGCWDCDSRALVG
jgi:hypothetical protein